MNIQVTMPKDVEYKVEDIDKIPNGGGVYLLLNSLYSLLYVGKSKDLRKRIKTHLKGSSESKFFYRNITIIKIIELPNAADRDIVETYLINTQRPRYNKAKTYFDRQTGTFIEDVNTTPPKTEIPNALEDQLDAKTLHYLYLLTEFILKNSPEGRINVRRFVEICEERGFRLPKLIVRSRVRGDIQHYFKERDINMQTNGITWQKATLQELRHFILETGKAWISVHELSNACHKNRRHIGYGSITRNPYVECKVMGFVEYYSAKS